jgi:PAS domain S-box-containing protein
MPTVSTIGIRPQECPDQPAESDGIDSNVLLNSLPLPALKVRQDWTILSVNSAWESLTGWTVESVTGSRLHDWLQPVDGVRLDRFSAKPETSNHRTGPSWDIAVRNKTGGWIWMDLALSWHPGDETSTPHFLCILTDVTHHHRSADQLRHALEREREAHRKTNEFVAMVSHELKLPVTNIGYAVELLRDSADRLGIEKRQRYHHLIHDNTVRLNRLADQLMLSGQIESGHWRMNPVDSDLRELCASVIAEFDHLNGDKSRIQFQSPEHSVWMRIDPALLRVSLSNLISNALKYSPIDTEVTVRIHPANPQVGIEVSDLGIGIRAEDASRLFSPFQRGSNVGNVKGNGMGLAITRTCVALQGGCLEWNRGVNGGTSFTIRLPAELLSTVQT